jgi:tetratricopeptide (TPR) repeat protein
MVDAHAPKLHDVITSTTSPPEDDLFWLELSGALDSQQQILEKQENKKQEDSKANVGIPVQTTRKTERGDQKRTPFSPLSARQLQNKKNVSNNVADRDISRQQKKTISVSEDGSNRLDDAKQQAHQHLLEGQKLLRQGEFIAALEKFTAAIVLNPDSETAYHKRACCYFRQKRYENAIIEFQLALKLATKLNNNDTLHRLHHDLGQACFSCHYQATLFQ